MAKRLGFASVLGFLALALASAAGAQVVEPVERFEFLDADGKLIGGSPLPSGPVTLRLSGGFITVSIGPNSLSTSKGGPLFESADCSGQPFIAGFARGFPETLDFTIAPPGLTVYTPTELAPRIIRALSEISKEDGSCQPVNNRFSEGGTDLTVLPARAEVDLATVFRTPYRVVAAPPTSVGADTCCSDCDGDGQVAINELVSGVGRALSGCP